MSNKPPTMSHTADQRRAWHNGKRFPRETRIDWFRRVFIKAKNFAGGYTPSGFRIAYRPLGDSAKIRRRQ